MVTKGVKIPLSSLPTITTTTTTSQTGNAATTTTATNNNITITPTKIDKPKDKGLPPKPIISVDKVNIYFIILVTHYF